MGRVKQQKTFDVYIAIPYSHPNPAVRVHRYNLATGYLAKLSAEKKVAFSPITHSHPMHEYDLPTDWEFWGAIDLRIISGCAELHVIIEDGWEESIGVQAEIKAAKKLGIPILYVGPGHAEYNPDRE